MDKFKDVTIEGREYRIELIPALTGNWIVNSLLASRTNEAIFASIQAHCFDVCSWLKTTPDGMKVPMKLFDKPNRWRLPDMEDDFASVTALYDAVLDFNFSPFFEKLAAKLQAANASPDTR